METVGRTGKIVLGVKMMWIVVAFGSAFFAGVTSILAKCGIRKTDSTVATAIRTIVVLIFSWLMVFVVGSQKQIGRIEGKTLLFLVLSGLATGASWLCYFKALQLGDINKVVPIDKSSTILTILLAFLFLHEAVSLPKIIGVVLIAIGTFLMIEKRDVNPGQAKGKGWLLYAVGAAVFASLTSILGNVGISGHSYRWGSGNVLGDGFCHGKTENGPEYSKERAWLYLPVGARHRGILAVLLSGAAGWTGKCGGSH